MPTWKVKATGKPSYEPLESRLSAKGCDELCAAVLEKAYNDLIDAMMIDAAFRFRKCSYNCATYYETISKRRHGKYKATQEEWDRAVREIDKYRRWFESEHCRLFLKEAKGKWFVEQANKHIERWALDEAPDWTLHPATLGKSFTKKEERDRMEKWSSARDEWRKMKGLKGVGSGKSN